MFGNTYIMNAWFETFLDIIDQGRYIIFIGEVIAGWVYVQDHWWSALELRDLLLLCCTEAAEPGPEHELGHVARESIIQW